MKYGYIRVSTVKQANEGNSLESQQKQLLENGIPKENIFKDVYTGVKADRPNFTKLLKILKDGDTLVVTKLDRFARSMIEGSKIVNELIEKGVKVHVLNIGMMDNTPNSRLIRNIFFSFAEFERDMIVERTQAGKEIAKQDPDFRDGRPKKYTKKQLEYAKQLKLEEKKTYKQIQQLLGISKATLCRYLAQTKK